MKKHAGKVLFVIATVLLAVAPAWGASTSTTMAGGDINRVTCAGLRLDEIRNDSRTRTLTCVPNPTTTTTTTTRPTTTTTTTRPTTTSTTTSTTTTSTTTTTSPAGLWYVSATGAGTACSSAAPCALQYALTNGSNRTIRVNPGTYSGCYQSDLVNARVEAVGHPLIVGNQDNCNPLQIFGSDTSYVGLDVSNGNTNRQAELGGAAFNVYGPRTKIINCFAHDAGIGIGLWVQAVGSEVYGCIMENNGFHSPTAGEGRGYGMYVQGESVSTPTTVENNHFLLGFSYGVHAYTEAGHLDGLHFIANTLGQSGAADSISGANAPNFWVGGADTADDLQLLNNLSYHQPSTAAGGGNKLSYGNGFASATITGNYFAGHDNFDTVVEFGGGGRNSNVSGNDILGGITDADKTAYPSNNYGDCCPSTGTKIKLVANKYQANRSELTIVNRTQATTVGVAVPAGTYEIRSAFDYWGKVVTVTSNGTLQVPMTGWSVQAVRGAPTPANPQPGFGDFVLQRVS